MHSSYKTVQVKKVKYSKVIKFKTMTDERDTDGNFLPDENRLTKVGKFVRSTSIDELPQLFNVLKGDMALIGPRPLLVQYLPLYSKEQARRHEVRPGITGWAQCNGRNAISWTRKFELDVWYVDHCSFLLDLRILFITLKKVFVREGISQDGTGDDGGFLQEIIKSRYVFVWRKWSQAKVIIDILCAQGSQVEGLIDDNSEIRELHGYPVFHGRSDLFPLIISIGDNRIRRMISQHMQGVFGRAIHPSAIVSPSATIGEGTVIMQGAIVQADAQIGKHCIINTGASIDHESVIADYVHISPHSTLCGNVYVGEGSWIGAGSIVIPGLRIGRWCVIGAGSVVTKDIPDGVLAVGNRCKIIKKIANGE